MERADAIRLFPTWGKETSSAQCAHWAPSPEGEGKKEEKVYGSEKQARIRRQLERAKKRYGLTVIAILGVLIWSMVLSGVTEARTEKRVRQEMASEYASQLEQYKQEMAEEAQAAHWLSGEASREAFVNQEIDAAARLAAKMNTDSQKGGIICNALARMMSGDYPNTMQDVIAQPNQWMFYSSDNKFSAHDREIAERILRAYYEDGQIPTGLTERYVYGSWSETDYVLRDSWEISSATHMWRYQG